MPGGGAGSGGSGGAASGSGGAAGGGATGNGLGPHCIDCTRTKAVGTNPRWEPKGAIILVGSIGPRGTNSSLLGWLTSFLAPNHLYFRSTNVLAPGRYHSPSPYDEEMSELAALKTTKDRPLVPKQTFSLAEYASLSGIVLLFNLVPTPDAPTGLHELGSGPMIPNFLFPLQLNCDIHQNGSAVYTAGDSSIPGYDMITEPLRQDGMPVDGASHVMMLFPANDTYTTTASGAFEYEVSITDAVGQGWSIVVPYTVE